MSRIKLLDCTLRDGGYINNWHFGKKVIYDICAKLSAANMDIVEVGFLTDVQHTCDDSLYSNTDEIVKVCPPPGGDTMYAAMIALGEKEINPASLPDAADTLLDIVRLTFHRTPEEINRAADYAKCLMSKGYKVCMQPVGTTSYTDKQLLELIELVNELKPYAFYLVDTLGILCREEMARFVYLIDYNLDESIKIGFHSHNNLQMSFSDAQFILEHRSPREFIVDCSVYGMGRGAGNLCTELIAQYTNNIGISEYNMVSVYDILDRYISPIRMEYEWGYNSHYYVAAVHKCHPNYASFLMNKQTLTMNEVDLILKNIPDDSKAVYSRQLISELYYSFQEHSVNDENAADMLKKQLCGKKILLLASGKSIDTYSETVKQYIALNNPVVFSINGRYKGYTSDYIFISNLKRLYTFDTENNSIPLIITSNLPNIVRNCLYVDYSKLCSKEIDEADNSGLMLIRLLIRVGVKELCVAGFDGFDEVSIYNYYDRKMINSISPEDASSKNQLIAKQFKQLMEQISITSLTPSRYF